MKKISNKGFTLIELLATILIIGLVLGVTTYGIIISVNKAKEKSTILSLASIKEAARTYSGELGEDSWKNGDKNTYFCVTIEELINKGLLNKNANSVENGGKIVDYVVVIKNKTTKVIEKEEILTDESDSNAEAYKICTGNIRNEVITSETKIDKISSYTDSVDIDFIDAGFEESEIKESYCEYGESSTNMNNNGTIKDNTCTLEKLTQGTTYYTKVCEKSKSEIESVSCSDTVYVTTKNIVAPSIAVDTNNSVIINYYNSDNNSNIKGEAFYYFKSTIGGISSENVSTCRLYENKYTCEEDSVNNITGGTWYRTTSKEISITYNVPVNITINAETRDKSDNSKSSTKEFSLHQTTFTITYDNNGGSGCTSKSVVNNSQIGALCTPSRTGYTFIGWYNSDYKDSPLNYYADTYSDLYDAFGYDADKLYNHYLTYGINEGKRISQYISTDIYNYSSNKTIYAGWKINKVNIRFNTNGGIVTSPTTTDSENTYKWKTDNNGLIYRTNANGDTYSSDFYSINYGKETGKDGLINYNNPKYLNITRTGYSAVSGKQWICQSGCTTNKETFNQASTPKYNASEFCDASNGDCTVTLGVNWTPNTYTVNYSCGTGSGTAPTSQTATYNQNFTAKSNTCTKTGFTFKEWNTSSDGTGTSYNPGSNYTYTNNQNITLYAIWTPNTYTVNYSCGTGSGTAPTSQTATYNQNFTAKSNTCTKTGFTFKEWNTSRDGTGTSYNPGSNYTYTNNQNITLYANWTPNTPQFIASDGKDSESWHIRNFYLTLTNTSDDVDYFYGTSENNITTKYSGQINVTNNNVTNKNTYYAKACSKSDYNNCSGVTTYVAKIDRNPPNVEITLKNTSTNDPISSDSDMYSSTKNNKLPWLPYHVTINYKFWDNETGIDTTTAQFKYNYEFQKELDDTVELVNDDISLSNGSTSYTRSVGLDGDRKFYFKICDAADNCSDKYIYFRTDTQKPIIYKIDDTVKDTVKIGCTTLSGIKDSVMYKDGIIRDGFVSKDYKSEYQTPTNGTITHPYNGASIYASCTNNAGTCSKVKIKKPSTSSQGCYYRVEYYGFDGPASSTVNKCSTDRIVGGVCGNQRIYTNCTTVDKSFCRAVGLNVGSSSRCVQYKEWYEGSNASDSFILEEQSSC